MRETILVVSMIASFTRGGILTHSKVYPFVVQLNATTDVVFSSEQFAEPLGDVTFNGHAFTCGKPPKPDEDVSHEDSMILERVGALEGICWDIERDMDSRILVQVCIGGDASEYTVGKDGNRSILRVIGTSDPVRDVSRTPNGFREIFQSNRTSVLVEYLCDRRAGENPRITEFSKTQINVSIPTFLVCPSLDDAEIGSIIQSLPALAMMSSDMFWEYQFTYPSHAVQRHSDATGATRNEAYSLGSESTGHYRTHEERSMDPQKLYIHPHIDMHLTGGAVCESHNLPRQSMVKFHCPADWESVEPQGWRKHYVPQISADKAFFARLAEVREPEVCEYELIVETTALCIDPGFIPTLFEISPHSISCLKIRT